LTRVLYARFRGEPCICVGEVSSSTRADVLHGAGRAPPWLTWNPSTNHSSRVSIIVACVQTRRDALGLTVVGSTSTHLKKLHSRAIPFGPELTSTSRERFQRSGRSTRACFFPDQIADCSSHYCGPVHVESPIANSKRHLDEDNGYVGDTKSGLKHTAKSGRLVDAHFEVP